VQIAPIEIQYRKRIGHLGSKAVIEISTIGGLKLVGIQEKSGKIRRLGAGSHRGIARFLAQRAEPTLEIDELEKSDEFRIEDFEDLLPFWQEVTDRLINAQ
jgi:hypothetical protein